MNTPDEVLLEENTRYLIARAGKLGYRIDSIDPSTGAITLTPTSTFTYTPAISQDAHGTWTMQAATHPALSVEEIHRLVDGYQRAAAMIETLLDYQPDVLNAYTR